MKNEGDLVLTALLCASEDGDVQDLKTLLEISPIDVNKTNKVSFFSLNYYLSYFELIFQI